ncbi:MAG: protein kinase [Roseibacillus sp.]
MDERPINIPDREFKAPEPAELSALLPGYEVSSLIGCSEMGAVYLARQTKLDRHAAIKILPREFGADPQFRSSFEAEAKAMARLNDPNLIRVYDFGEVDDFLYIIMEAVDGKSLFRSAHGIAIEQREVARLIHGICEGLAHAHEVGIIHRDINPSNILLDSNKRPKIGDFGLARPIDSAAGDDIHVGTPDYTAPEVMVDPANAGKRSDVFSTGVILYELLTGELPGKNFVPPSQLQEVDPCFDKIVRRALHPAPAMRFADAGEMAKEVGSLKEALDEPGGLAKSRARPAKLIPASDAESDIPVAPLASAQESARHRRILIRNLVIIAILLVAILAMFIAYNRRVKDNKRKEKLADKEQLTPKEPGWTKIPRRPRETPPGRLAPGPKPPPRSAPDPEPEQSPDLKRLRRTLANGDRSRFPRGTQDYGESRVFLVRSAMGWREASDFAEAHGAHLATIPGEAEKATLSSLIPEDTAVWLGGGTVGPSSWGWIDGSEWTLPGKPSSAAGNHLSLANRGTLRGNPGAKKFPFLIQWRMDGENPGRLDAQWERLVNSLGQATPAYPPGTIFHGKRRYFFKEESTSWDEALKIARAAGGHLAVPRDESEWDFLKAAITSTLPKDEVAWIGGHYAKGSWAWTTGEPWEFSAWIPKPSSVLEVDKTALCIVPWSNGHSWDNADPHDNQTASAFVIEWSPDREAPATPSPVKTATWTELRTQTAAKITRGRAQHTKKIKDNGTAMNRALENWYNTLDRKIRGRYFNVVQLARQKIQKDGRIDEKGSFPPLPADIGPTCNICLNNQRILDTNFNNAADQVRGTYLNEMRGHREAAHSERLFDTVKAIEEELEDCGEDLDAFLNHFFPNP